MDTVVIIQELSFHPSKNFNKKAADLNSDELAPSSREDIWADVVV